MDSLYNPFSPGAGSPPPTLTGREKTLSQAQTLLGRVMLGNPQRSMILTGLRGVGKTVLLNEIEDIAQQKGFKTIFIEAHVGKSLVESLVPRLRSVLYSLDRLAKMGSQVKLALGVLKSFIASFKASIHDFSVGIDINPELGIADSGDLEFDLPELFLVIAAAAKAHGKCLLLLIDEVQYFSERELSALIMAMHKIHQKKMPIAFVGAGLPIIPALAGDSKTYAERLFDFPVIDALSRTEVEHALNKPAAERDVKFTDDAITEIYNKTLGYPYFVQFWAYQAWDMATEQVITKDDVIACTKESIKKLDESFFRVRFDRITNREKEFLRAMAALGSGPYQVKHIASELSSTTANVTTHRTNLIQKGMIYSPRYGYLDFSVPVFDEFMRRTMP
jgi:hypothetical protein